MSLLDDVPSDETNPDDSLSHEERREKAGYPNYCDGDVENNVWVEGVVDASRGLRGICMLNTLYEDQIVVTLQMDPRASKDLLRVTSDPYLRDLAQRIGVNKTPINEGDYETHANVTAPAGMPEYTLFQGNPPRNPGNGL